MSDMKCPVCNKQMKIGTLDLDDSMGTVWMSIMPCDCVCSYGASKAVWQALIDTKKKLDTCVKALNKIANTDIKVIEKEPLYYARAMFSVTNNALNRIQDIE